MQSIISEVGNNKVSICLFSRPGGKENENKLKQFPIQAISKGKEHRFYKETGGRSEGCLQWLQNKSKIALA